MKKLFLVLASLFLTSQSFANDSAISGTSGTPGAMKAMVLAGEHKSIRMVSEHIEMRVGVTDYVTAANFIFHNSGAATTVRMGFPEGAGGDSDYSEMRKKTSFKEFETWVDGKRIKATRMISGEKPDIFEFDAYWVKSVRFARNQTRRVRVRYRSELGITVASSYVFYDFTGGNWKGKVDESTLRLTFTVPGTYRIFPSEYTVNKPQRRDRNNEMNYRWRNWQAQENFVLRFSRTLPNGLIWAADPKDLNESGELYPDMQTITVKGKGKFDPWSGQAQLQTQAAPGAVLRNGRAFVKFRGLIDDMQYSWEHKNEGRKLQYGAGLRAKNGVVIAPYFGRPNQTISVKIGKKTANIGARKIELSDAPFVAGGVLYVPMASMIQALGGQAKVNAKTARYWYKIPVK